MRVIGYTQVAGDGCWSDTAIDKLGITRITVARDPQESVLTLDHAELRAYFDPTAWDCNDVGIIYTDKLWIKTFRELLESRGFTQGAAQDVDYSEAGMQTHQYVSMDVGNKFLRETDKFFRFTNGLGPLLKGIDDDIN